MNVDMGTFNSNVARLRIRRQQAEQIQALQKIEKLRKDAQEGLTIEKSPNKAKIEISMININKQVDEQSKAQQDLMRQSVVTKRSYGDVTTLEAQSTAGFNLTTYMSPPAKRAAKDQSKLNN